MVPKRKNAFIRQIKDITIGSSLTLVLMGSGMFVSGCSEPEKETVYTKGVQTYITEIDKNVFKITDEVVVPEGQSLAYVKYLDGRNDTLTIDEAKQIVAIEADTTLAYKSEDNNTVRQGGVQHGGLGNVLYWGGLGYLMGRSHMFGPQPGFYANPSAYQQAQQSSSTLTNSRVTRPVNSKSGFFKSSRSSSAAS